MIRTLSSFEPYCDFIRSFSNDPVFSDPMLVTEAQRQKHLYEVPADPCACLLGSFAGETLTGLFVFLILEKDRYVQMLAGLTRSRKACAEDPGAGTDGTSCGARSQAASKAET